MESWFPADDEVLKKVRDGLSEGRYTANRSLLLEDLKEDHSLFLYCIRELIRLVTGSGSQEKLNPLAVLESADEEKLRHVLNVESRVISQRSKAAASPPQAARTFEAAVSATTAETLAESYEIDHNLAHACAIFRQLGLTLIAWNYSFVYKRVVATIRPTESLDSALERVLGFSPSALGIAVGRRWHLSDEVLCSMGDAERSVSATAELREIGEKIADVCRLGETVARVATTGPEALAAEWEKAKGGIQDILGEQGLSMLQGAIRSKCGRHAPAGTFDKTLETLFADQPGPAIVNDTVGPKVRRSIETNTDINLLPEEAQAAIAKLYRRTAAGAGPNEIVNAFTAEVLPLAGFSKGAVFFVQPDNASLVMSTNYGRCDLAPAYKIKLPGAQIGDPISSVYAQSGLTYERNIVVAGKEVSYIAASLGHTEHRGVLYAEIDEQVFKWLEADPPGCFKVLKQGLEDCLGIE